MWPLAAAAGRRSYRKTTIIGTTSTKTAIVFQAPRCGSGSYKKYIYFCDLKGDLQYVGNLIAEHCPLLRHGMPLKDDRL
jgi:hypothetical protein